MSIQVGVAWFEDLRRDRTTIDVVDFVELPGWLLSPEFERPHQRIILHNLDRDWSLAADAACTGDWSLRLQSATSFSQTPWFSAHLGFASECVRFDGHMLPESKPLERGEILDRIVHNVAEAQSACPLPFLLENLDYCPEGAYEHVCDPSFIAETLEQTARASCST